MSILVMVEIPTAAATNMSTTRRKSASILIECFSLCTLPADYGFIPNTLAEDGDELDALVLWEKRHFLAVLFG